MEFGRFSENQTLPLFEMKLQFFGGFGALAGRSEDIARLQTGATLFDLLQTLATRYGESFRAELLQSDGALRDDVMITVNGTIMNHAVAADKALHPNDTLALFPVFPGGG